MQDISLVIITGLSGAGKTQATWCLEDLGFFCVDNLPPNLIPKFSELCAQSEGKLNKIALVIDIRGRAFFDRVFEVLDTLEAQGVKYEILFLEASNETLVRRFKESRRRHPLSNEGRVLEGILEERKKLEDLRGQASKIIDTTNMSVQQLKQEVTELFATGRNSKQLAITVMSFGFKYGIPLDADMVLDVRFLPNPHYIPELRPLTGDDKEVQDYVLKFEVSQSFLKQLEGMITFLLPHYLEEGKRHFVIAIGCTGGQHRSVTIANKLVEGLKNSEHQLSKQHRDMERNKAGVG